MIKFKKLNEIVLVIWKLEFGIFWGFVICDLKYGWELSVGLRTFFQNLRPFISNKMPK